MAVCRPTGQEAQTAAGVRGRAFLPKTARRAPQALEAGAFWVRRPKRLSIRSLAVLLRRGLAVFALSGGVLFKVPPADLIPCGGSGPLGRPLSRLRATAPLSGEPRPKSRLRRLAV